MVEVYPAWWESGVPDELVLDGECDECGARLGEGLVCPGCGAVYAHQPAYVLDGPDGVDTNEVPF